MCGTIRRLRKNHKASTFCLHPIAGSEIRVMGDPIRRAFNRTNNLSTAELSLLLDTIVEAHTFTHPLPLRMLVRGRPGREEPMRLGRLLQTDQAEPIPRPPLDRSSGD